MPVFRLQPQPRESFSYLPAFCTTRRLLPQQAVPSWVSRSGPSEALDDNPSARRVACVCKLPPFVFVVFALCARPPARPPSHHSLPSLYVPILFLQERRDPALSRADYLERLAKDLKEYYGFLRELVDMFLLVSFCLPRLGCAAGRCLRWLARRLLYFPLAFSSGRVGDESVSAASRCLPF